jgi:hypothetical protein
MLCKLKKKTKQKISSESSAACLTCFACLLAQGDFTRGFKVQRPMNFSAKRRALDLENQKSG